MSKWGNTIDEASRQLAGQDPSPAYVRSALQASLARLGTDFSDVYLLHLFGLEKERAVELLGTLQQLVAEGRSGATGGTSTTPNSLRRGRDSRV